MAIYLGSRYENSTVDFLAYRSTETAAPVVFYQFPDIGRITYSEYSWKDGDRMDQVATKFYRYPELWWLVAQANPQINDHSKIPAGAVLRIPVV